MAMTMSNLMRGGIDGEIKKTTEEGSLSLRGKPAAAVLNKHDQG